jgi:hypothetical protein
MSEETKDRKPVESIRGRVTDGRHPMQMMPTPQEPSTPPVENTTGICVGDLRGGREPMQVIPTPQLPTAPAPAQTTPASTPPPTSEKNSKP